MRTYGLIHYVNHFKVGVVSVSFIHPCDNGIIAVCYRQAAVEPAVGILGSPYKGVELEQDSVVFGVVVCVIGSSPVVITAVTLDR